MWPKKFDFEIECNPFKRRSIFFVIPITPPSARSWKFRKLLCLIPCMPDHICICLYIGGVRVSTCPLLFCVFPLTIGHNAARKRSAILYSEMPHGTNLWTQTDSRNRRLERRAAGHSCCPEDTDTVDSQLEYRRSVSRRNQARICHSGHRLCCAGRSSVLWVRRGKHSKWTYISNECAFALL